MIKMPPTYSSQSGGQTTLRPPIPESHAMLAGNKSQSADVGVATHYSPNTGTDNASPESTFASPTPDIWKLVERNRSKMATTVRSVFPLTGITDMKKWEGRVVGLSDDSLTLEIESDSDPTVHADFDRSLLGESDAQAIRMGDIVYLTVRTVTDGLRRPHPTSSIRRRRPPKWTEIQLKEAQERAARKLQRFREGLR